ncbi:MULTISPECIES: substrate-binding domain-containing protein [Serratia]|uniref:Substrate-binding domain-containing protein n=1 Tax=Serratia fonticola TaxID=47917 RepID=A0AAE7SX34_SERFO|nr:MULTISPECIES: substrate-binding domain-containing protein [Serratia]MBC3231252.1 substrate-binding domain-containing protein [Serratia fonticola]QXT42553.1 substrate-binding domain-containing protein [Serratia fonticola]CAI1995140.1 Accessory colonization factor AcfC, contains ABC-type periplasmic domain [Serratia fonticola]
MKIRKLIITTAAIMASCSTYASGQFLDTSIVHHPKDGVVRLYGPGGPHTALIKAAAGFEKKTGQHVEVIYGPEKKWSKEAQQRADIIFSASEQSMTAYLENYPFVTSKDVMPMFIHPAVIAVAKGNPKNIKSFADLINHPMKIVVTEGKGTYNTSGTGLWEDIAGRLGKLDDIKKVRANIVAFEQGSGAAFKSFQNLKADAWITWSDWPIANADKVDMVTIEPERMIYRDFNLAISPKADAGAAQFSAYLETAEGAQFFKEEGWLR